MISNKDKKWLAFKYPGLKTIKEEISGMEYINVPYKTRSWTIQSTKK